MKGEYPTELRTREAQSAWADTAVRERELTDHKDHLTLSADLQYMGQLFLLGCWNEKGPS